MVEKTGMKLEHLSNEEQTAAIVEAVRNAETNALNMRIQAIQNPATEQQAAAHEQRVKALTKAAAERGVEGPFLSDSERAVTIDQAIGQIERQYLAAELAVAAGEGDESEMERLVEAKAKVKALK